MGRRKKADLMSEENNEESLEIPEKKQKLKKKQCLTCGQWIKPLTDKQIKALQLKGAKLEEQMEEIERKITESEELKAELEELEE